jgi:hypothetical protein
MAKLSAVIAGLSDVLGTPETAVESYAKPLRKAGLITSGPRGTAAPEIPVVEMSRLLIAVLNGSPARAVRNVTDYSQLVADPYQPKEQLAFTSAFDLAPQHTFLEMLTKLIECHADNSFTERGIQAVRKAEIYHEDDLNKALKRNDPEDPVIQEFQNFLFIDVYYPLPAAAITLGTSLFMAGEMTKHIRIYYQPPESLKPEEKHIDTTSLKEPSDLQHTSSVGDRTIGVLAKLITS